MTFNTWTNSALYTLQQCGERFRRRHIEGERVESTVPQVTGSSVHVVTAEAHKRQMATNREWDGDEPLITEQPGTIRASEEAADLAATEYDKRIKRDGLRFVDEEREEGEAKVTARGKDAAVLMGAYYVRDVAPVIVPAAVERKITVKPRSMDILILGTTDLVERRAGGEVINDTKTSKRTPPRGSADRSNQLTMYAMLRGAEKQTGPTERVVLNTIVLTPKGRVPSYDRQESKRDADDVRALVSQINVAVSAVQRGVFMPNTNGWWCDRRWCEFYPTCPYVNAKRTSVAVP